MNKLEIAVLIWGIVSIITLILEFSIVRKLINDKYFVDEFMEIYDAEKMKKYAKTKKWLVYAMCPIFNIFFCLALILIYIYEIINFDDFKKEMLLEIKKISNIEG